MFTFVLLTAPQLQFAAPPPGAPSTANTLQEPPSSLIDFGREVAGHLRRGEGDVLAQLYAPVDVECPRENVAGQIIPLCEGVADGTIVPGCITARLFSDAGYLDCDDRIGEVLSNAVATEFMSNDVRLYTISLTGTTVGTTACPECSQLIFSTPADDEFDPRPDIPGVEANIMFFQVRETASGYRIHSFTVGRIVSNFDNFAILYGGTVDGKTYYPVDAPGPPATGSGLAGDTSDVLDWPVLTAVLLAASAMLFALARRPAH